MSIYSIVTEKDSNNLRKLAEQQKEQRAEKIKSRNLKQTHDIKLAENLSPITEKLDGVNICTQEFLSPITKKLGEIVKESNSENNKEMAITPSILSQKAFQSLAEANNSLKLHQDKTHSKSILGVPIKAQGGDKIQVYENIYEFGPEIRKALSLSSYTGKSMKNENDRRTLYNFLTDVGYTGDVDGKTK